MADDDKPNGLRKRNEKLLEQILDVMRSPGPLEVDDPEKDAADQAAFEDYYRRTGQVADALPIARTVPEMLFAASLVPCTHCGSSAPTELALHGSGGRWAVTGPCPACGETNRDHYRKDWLAGELARVLAIVDAFERTEPQFDRRKPPAGSLDATSRAAHDAWLAAWRQGPGRLVVVRHDARRIQLAA